MNFCCCNKCNCTAAAIVASVILGVIAAFLQVTAVITLTPVFLVVAFGIAIAYLGVLVVANAMRCECSGTRCLCSALNAALVGLLGTVFFALVLLATGIVATSVITAILVGLLSASFALMILSTVCYVRAIADCSSER